MGINRAEISGNLTRDSELRVMQSGKAVLNFSVAVTDRRLNRDTGEWEDVPCYVDCVMFGKRAESVARYLVKGTKVCIDGKLRYSSWEDKNGQKRTKLEVAVEEFEFVSRQNAEHPSEQPSFSLPPATDVYAEDLPF